MTVDELQRCLHHHFAPWVRSLPLHVQQRSDNSLTLTLAADAQLYDASGALSAQVYAVAAQTAMSLALTRSESDLSTMHCMAFNMNVMNTRYANSVTLVASILRRGRSVAFGEISLYDQQSQLVAHASATYTLR